MTIDHRAIAERVASDGYTQSFGMLVDFSPASLVVLDSLLDILWGKEGELGRDPSWQIGPEQAKQAVTYGSYLGEVICRTFGGTWSVHPQDSSQTTVRMLPDLFVRPMHKIARRMRFGAIDSVYSLYQHVRQQHAPVIEIDEDAMLIHHADYVYQQAPEKIRADLSCTVLEHLTGRLTVTSVGAMTCTQCHRETPTKATTCRWCHAPLW